MENENQDNKIECFIIMPIGEKGSSIQNKSFGLLESVIKPVLEKLNIKCNPPSEILDTGAITNQVINHIVNDDLVIANLTNLNANVMYEIGIRHTIAKPIVTLCEEGTSLPFDISNQRNIFYEDSFSGLGQAVEDLTKFLEKIKNKTEDKNNPVFNATKTVANPKDNSVQIDDFLKQMANDISSLKADFSNSKSSYQGILSRPVKSTLTDADLNIDLGNLKTTKINVDSKSDLVFKDYLKK